MANNLASILPNISVEKPKKRRLLANVVHSIILYGAPIWAPKMSQKGKRVLAKVQRCVALRVASAYCTVSYAGNRLLSRHVSSRASTLTHLNRDVTFGNTLLSCFITSQYLVGCPPLYPRVACFLIKIDCGSSSSSSGWE